MGVKPRPLRLRLFADYRQIHVREPDARGDLGDAWTARASDDRVAAARDIVGIGTEEVDDVAVEVSVVDAEPADDAAAWDRVTESSIEVTTGELAILGCTDYIPDARRIRLAAGSWRIRASHGGLARGKEQIRLQLWPAPAAEPRVVKRWTPPPPAPKPPAKGRPRNAKKAAEAARRGQTDLALEVLRELADAGDAAAAASAAELLAFRGQWQELIPYASALLARPDAVYAGNVFDDMCGLIRRAARELGDDSIIRAASAKVPASMREERKANLLRDWVHPYAVPDREDRARYDDAVAMAEQGKQFAGKQRELHRHCFALAFAFGVEDELVRRWDPEHPHFHFDQAVQVARVVARRGDADRAWAILEERLPRWYPVDFAQVAPVILLRDPWLSPLMTPARGERVLATPRGHEAT